MINRRTILKDIVAVTTIGTTGLTGSTWAAAPGASSQPIAETQAGKVRGSVEGGVYAFKGVPYGADTATTRYRSPKPPQPWTGIRDALVDGPMAPQASKARTYKDMSEDCLVLNLWTPEFKDNKRRPVMLWLHGGGTTGGSSRGVYGANLARKGDVVVIAINHRLGAFGYLYLADLAEELPDSGNAGMLDIVRALEWVRDNIESFGGDPGNVTVFGCSGGGAKLSILMGIPAAKGLFHKAIIESGASDLRTKSRAEGSEATAKYLAELKITSANVRKLYGLSMPQLLDGLKSSTVALDDMGSGRFFSPVIDGKNLPRDSFVPDASPVCSDVPLIVGCGRWEYTSLLGMSDPKLFDLSWDEVPRRLSEVWKDFRLPHDPQYVVREYRRLYPSYTPSEVFFLAVTDSKFWIGALTQASRKAAQRAAPVYHYVVDWTTPVQGGRLRAPHGIEVPLVFDSVKEAPGLTGGGPDAQHMADQMSSAWIAFAHTGNPDTKGIPHWPAYEIDTRATMFFDTESKVVKDADHEKRLIWEKLQQAVHA